ARDPKATAPRETAKATKWQQESGPPPAAWKRSPPCLWRQRLRLIPARPPGVTSRLPKCPAPRAPAKPPGDAGSNTPSQTARSRPAAINRSRSVSWFGWLVRGSQRRWGAGTGGLVRRVGRVGRVSCADRVGGGRRALSRLGRSPDGLIV